MCFDLADGAQLHFTPHTGYGVWAGGTEYYGVNFVLLNKIVCFVLLMCHIIPICHFSVDLKFSHT
jgi:hypothetical protein